MKVGEVYVMDASRRTTAANAYVTGLGSTKRVVLFDTLLKDFPPRRGRGVVAHELGHVHYRDVPRGLLYLAIVAPFGMLAVARLASGWRRGAGPLAVPAVALAIAAARRRPITVVSNQLSRAVEAPRRPLLDGAHARSATALIAFQRGSRVQNVGRPRPARLGRVPAGHAPDRDASGSVRRWRSSAGSSGPSPDAGTPGGS